LADASVSRVYSIDVLQQVADPGRTLAELVRVGRPGALYLLTVPDPVQSRFQRQFAPSGVFSPADPAAPTTRGVPCGQLRVIERDAFSDMAAAAGLEIERREGFGFFWAMYFALFWACDVDMSSPGHPALVNWVRTWDIALDAPQGPRLQRIMDDFMPRSQLILARKP
jgi:hypothetical protein